LDGRLCCRRWGDMGTWTDYMELCRPKTYTVNQVNSECSLAVLKARSDLGDKDITVTKIRIAGQQCIFQWLC